MTSFWERKICTLSVWIGVGTASITGPGATRALQLLGEHVCHSFQEDLALFLDSTLLVTYIYLALDGQWIQRICDTSITCLCSLWSVLGGKLVSSIYLLGSFCQLRLLLLIPTPITLPVLRFASFSQSFFNYESTTVFRWCHRNPALRSARPSGVS
jgi:hypothetical protein